MINIRQSKFKHVYGKPAKKEQSYENINVTKSNSESSYLAVNSKYLAFISEVGGGGIFTVIPLTKTGRQDINTGIISGHTAPVTDLAWCPFNESIIASASEDCSVKIWKIDEADGVISFENLVTLMGHQRKVVHIKWHFLVESVLISSGADNKLILWNLETNEPHHTLDFPRQISSMSLNYSGTTLCIGSRESHVSLVNLIDWKIIQEANCHESSKAVHVAFVDDEHFITTGFSKQSDRQLALWKVDNLSKPIKNIDIDTSNGSLYPFFDYDTKMLFLLAKGDTVIRYFEFDKSDCEIHYLNRYDATEPQRGFNFMPKIGLNVNINEVMRLYKLTNKKVCEVVSFIVPRKSEMFQDDIFPDTMAPVPALTFEEWIQGKEPKINKYSMRENYGKSVITRGPSVRWNMMNNVNRHSTFFQGNSDITNQANNSDPSSVDQLKTELNQTKDLVKDLMERVSILEDRLMSPVIKQQSVE